MSLVDPPDRAVAHVRQRAEGARLHALRRVTEILATAGEPLEAMELLRALVCDHARVTLNFHPDRLGADGRTVAEGLLRDGKYRSQFETGLSNGSRTAFPGGERDAWERALFGGAYHSVDRGGHERPKYGALNLMQHPDGGSPRFGSCYVVLRDHMRARCTLTWGDSHGGPDHVGTTEAPEPILAAILDAAETRGNVLGVAGMSVGGLLRRLASPEARSAPDPEDVPAGRALDDYVEAQVHGSIDLADDVETLVVDPAFTGTETGDVLAALSERHAIPLLRHQGFVLGPDEVPADFRGPRMVPLAHRVAEHHAARGGIIDAASIGRAAESLHRDPASWADGGTYDETLQHIKQLWHVLVRFGHPRDSRARSLPEA